MKSNLMDLKMEPDVDTVSFKINIYERLLLVRSSVSNLISFLCYLWMLPSVFKA